MALIKEGLKDIKDPELIVKSRYIISQITQNLTPPPQLAEVIAATEAMAEANDASMGRGTQSINVKREKREALLFQLKRLASWVQMNSKGIAVEITQTGFEVRKGNARLGLLPAPKGLNTILTKMARCVILRWKPVHGKRTYLVEMNRGDVMDESRWEPYTQVTRTKAIIKNLESGRKYWFRVKALGTAGMSPASAPVQGMAW